jgi:polyhydroxyalkanoate synthase
VNSYLTGWDCVFDRAGSTADCTKKIFAWLGEIGYSGETEKECQLRNEETIKNFLRMEKWIFDSPDQAGETYRQFIKDCYQKNLLIKNEMEIDGKNIDLRKITMPLLNVMAEFDHLVPNDASRPLADAVSSKEKETLVFPTGHVGIFVGSRSQKEVCPRISEWLGPRSLLDGPGEKKPKAKRKSPQSRKNEK